MPVKKVGFFCVFFLALPFSALADCSISIDAKTNGVKSDCAPKEMASYIERELNCGHWSGEEAYDADRKKEIEAALTKLQCNKLVCDREKLNVKYAKQKDLLKQMENILDNYVYIDQSWKQEVCKQGEKI